MMDDMEQMIKEHLLKNLIDKMSEQGGHRLKPKEMAVEVAAPSEGKLAEGLDKAKDLVDHPDSESASEEDDEHRLMQLLDEDEEDEEKK